MVENRYKAKYPKAHISLIYIGRVRLFSCMIAHSTQKWERASSNRAQYYTTQTKSEKPIPMRHYTLVILVKEIIHREEKITSDVFPPHPVSGDRILCPRRVGQRGRAGPQPLLGRRRLPLARPGAHGSGRHRQEVRREQMHRDNTDAAPRGGKRAKGQQRQMRAPHSLNTWCRAVPLSPTFIFRVQERGGDGWGTNIWTIHFFTFSIAVLQYSNI